MIDNPFLQTTLRALELLPMLQAVGQLCSTFHFRELLGVAVGAVQSKSQPAGQVFTAHTKTIPGLAAPECHLTSPLLA